MSSDTEKEMKNTKKMLLFFFVLFFVVFFIIFIAEDWITQEKIQIYFFNFGHL